MSTEQERSGKSEPDGAEFPSWMSSLIDLGCEPEGEIIYTVNRYGQGAAGNSRVSLEFEELKESLDQLRGNWHPATNATEAADLLTKYNKLRDACTRAEMGIMETSGEWSLHDVSARGKELEQQTLDIVNRNVDLEVESADLRAEVERLREELTKANKQSELRNEAFAMVVKMINKLLAGENPWEYPAWLPMEFMGTWHKLEDTTKKVRDGIVEIAQLRTQLASVERLREAAGRLLELIDEAGGGAQDDRVFAQFEFDELRAAIESKGAADD